MFAQAEKKTCYNRGHKHKFDAALLGKSSRNWHGTYSESGAHAS